MFDFRFSSGFRLRGVAISAGVVERGLGFELVAQAWESLKVIIEP